MCKPSTARNSADEGRMATSRRCISAGALLLLTLLSNCMGAPFVVTTLESDLGDSIIDRRLRTSGAFSSDVKTSAFYFQKGVIEDLEKGGHLRSTEVLGGYLASAGMACSSQSATKQICRLSRYMIERLDSHSPEDDGTSRIEWNVIVVWNRNDSPVRPTVTMDRIARRVSADR